MDSLIPIRQELFPEFTNDSRQILMQRKDLALCRVCSKMLERYMLDRVWGWKFG